MVTNVVTMIEPSASAAGPHARESEAPALTQQSELVQQAEQFEQVEQLILERTPEHQVSPTLERMEQVAHLLGNPQQSCPVIQVTGTNGKTSTARMIESLLRAFGLKTGLFTSPHLHSMRERICLDGVPVDPARFVQAYEELEPYLAIVDQHASQRGQIPLTYFEVLTALGYAIFADAPVDVMVVEVGMGGSWDATSIATPQVAVLTPIDIDHTAYLGESVEQIATEKAGIIKPGSVAIIGEQKPEVAQIIARRAVEVDAVIASQAAQFEVGSRALAVGGQMLELDGLGGQYEQVFVPLHGQHQADNASCALAAVEAFFGARKGRRLDVDTVRAGFAQVRSAGRLELVRTSPTVLLDAAHNPAGARASAAALAEAFTLSRIVGVIGCMADKDATGILEAFEPVLSEVVITEAATPRAMASEQLSLLAQQVFGQDRVQSSPRLDQALELAITTVEQQEQLGSGAVLVTGSITTVAQARQLLGAPTLAQQFAAGAFSGQGYDDPAIDDAEFEQRSFGSWEQDR